MLITKRAINYENKDEIKLNPKILLIIPAYNEADGIEDVIRKVNDYRKNYKYILDYIVINDGSTDNEEEILRKNDINHVELVNNLGIGGAVQTGYIYALENDYDIAVQFDGDGQHDIQSLPNLIEPLINDVADFTVGSRFVSDSKSSFKSTGARQAGIKILSNLIYMLTGLRIKDVTSGYRAGNRKVIEQFVSRYPSQYPEPESYMHLIAKNIRVKEVGVRMFERTSGKSSIHLLDSVAYMFNVSISILIASLIERRISNMPIQLQIIAIFLAIGFLLLTIFLIRKDHAEVRQMNKWLFLSVIMIFGALFPSLGTKIAHSFGITTLTSLALFTVTAFLLFIALTSSIALINTQRQIKTLTQQLSLLKHEMNKLKKEKQ